MGSRFVIYQRERLETTLSEDSPWGERSSRAPRAKLRLGWRCACQTSWDSGVKEFLESLQENSVWVTSGHTVHVAGVRVKGPTQLDGGVLVIDLWTEGSGDLPGELQRAENALDIVCQQIQARLGLNGYGVYSVEKKQEFVELKLPSSIARNLPADRAKAAIWVHRAPSAPYVSGEKLPTIQVAGNWLRLGPEHPGAIDAVSKYVRQEVGGRVRRRHPDTQTHGGWFWVPVLMVVSMLFAWALPLRVWSLVFIACVLMLLMIVAVFPARREGRSWFGQAPIVTSLGFFGIGAFGIAYSICQLVDGKALGDVSALGYPFLVSTGLGVAGGVLGDSPRGAARIVAHIQLLLFLGGLAGVFAILLRIARNTTPGE
jgi:hypothetical protein